MLFLCYTYFYSISMVIPPNFAWIIGQSCLSINDTKQKNQMLTDMGSV